MGSSSCVCICVCICNGWAEVAAVGSWFLKVRVQPWAKITGGSCICYPPTRARCAQQLQRYFCCICISITTVFLLYLYFHPLKIMVVLLIFRYQLYFVIYIPELELNESYQVKWHEILNWLNLKQTWIRLETGWQLSVFEMGCDRCCHRKCVESLFYIFFMKRHWQVLLLISQHTRPT